VALGGARRGLTFYSVFAENVSVFASQFLLGMSQLLLRMSRFLLRTFFVC
jgi:hypothetical protein